MNTYTYTHREVIAINQDKLGVQGKLVLSYPRASQGPHDLKHSSQVLESSVGASSCEECSVGASSCVRSSVGASSCVRSSVGASCVRASSREGVYCGS